MTAKELAALVDHDVRVRFRLGRKAARAFDRAIDAAIGKTESRYLLFWEWVAYEEARRNGVKSETQRHGRAIARIIRRELVAGNPGIFNTLAELQKQVRFPKGRKPVASLKTHAPQRLEILRVIRELAADLGRLPKRSEIMDALDAPGIVDTRVSEVLRVIRQELETVR